MYAFIYNDGKLEQNYEPLKIKPKDLLPLAYNGSKTTPSREE